MRKIYLLFIVWGLFIPGFLFAQIPNPLQINVVPKYPEPNKSVSVSLGASSISLNNSQISWYVNDTLQTSGTGETQFNYQLGDVGEQTTIAVALQTTDGRQLQNEVVITPAEVDIVWEANTYTPPFYRGRSLFSSESTLTLLAVPNIVRNGSTIPSSQLIYTWEHDSTVLGSKSGTGKNSLTLTGSVLSQSEVVAVEVKTLDGSIKARERIVIPITNSFIRIYEDNPLLGVRFHKSLDATTNISNEEITLQAVPFFVPIGHPRGLVWDWVVGDVHTYDHEITLRNTTDTISGKVPVRVSAKKQGTLLHSPEMNFELIFE